MCHRSRDWFRDHKNAEIKVKSWNQINFLKQNKIFEHMKKNLFLQIVGIEKPFINQIDRFCNI